MRPSIVPRKKEIQDYHIVPREEKHAHEYEGPDCKCEPRCVLMGDGFRIFVHQTHIIDVLKKRPPSAPAGLLGPGPPSGVK